MNKDTLSTKITTIRVNLVYLENHLGLTKDEQVQKYIYDELCQISSRVEDLSEIAFRNKKED